MTSEDTTKTLKFRLGLPDQPIQELIVESGRALIGSGAHCEVRLPSSSAAREHADVVLEGRTVWVRALAKEPAICLGSEPLVEATWSPSLTLRIGEASLWVDVVEHRATTQTRSPLVALGLVPFFAVAAALLQLLAGAQTPKPPITAAPALFDSQPAHCPTDDVGAAAAAGQERWRMALAKRERSPFWPRDGVQAVALFDAAAACLAKAGLAESKTAKDQGDRLRSKLEADYRGRVVRLEHAYANNDLAGMGRELSSLTSLIEHRSGPYVEWVLALSRFADSENRALHDRRRMPGAR